MAAHSLKEQASIVPRRLACSSIPPRVATSRRPHFTSKFLTALDAGLAELTAVDPLPDLRPQNDDAQASSRMSPAPRESAELKRTFSLHSGINATAGGAGPASRNESSNARPKAPKAKRARRAAANPTSHLPWYSYKDFSPSPARVYTRIEDEANELVSALTGPLGFDLEWRVVFLKNLPARRTALVQLCDRRMILLVQVSAMKRFPEKVKEIIESKDIVKTGANILNDGQKLFRDFGIAAQNLVELGSFAQQADPSFPTSLYRPRGIVSLAKITEQYTQRTLFKGPERTSNWEAHLSDEQQEYAANDAHCALMVYTTLADMARAANIKLDPVQYTGAVQPPAGSSIQPASTAAKNTTAGDKDIASNWPVGSSSPEALHGVYQRPQNIRAYNLWHHRLMPLDDICVIMRSKDNPLKESTVISYIVRALKADATLPFSYQRLVALIQMEAGSWARHREWLLSKNKDEDKA